MTRLRDAISGIEAEHDGQFSISALDLGSGRCFELRAAARRETASAFKLCVLCELFRQAEAGMVDLDAPLAWEARHFRTGDGVLRAMQPGQALSVYNMAVLMIIISDNIATNVVLELVGAANVTRTMHEWGLTDTDIHDGLPAGPRAAEMTQPVSTARDLCGLIRRIRRHEVLTPARCDDIIRILRAQRCNDMLPRFLPVGEDWGEAPAWIANKTGYGRCRVEVGFVRADGRELALAVFFEPRTAPDWNRKCLADYPPVLAVAHACKAVWETMG